MELIFGVRFAISSNMRTLGISLLLASIATLSPFNAAWGASTKTLPKGIRSFALRTGFIQGLNQGFDDSGSQLGIGDLKSVRFDSDFLTHSSDRSRLLVDALNSIGSQNLGNQLNLGTLKIDARPEVKFMAPVLAFGVQSHWTLALAIPVISFKNEVSYRVEDSNVDYYRQIGAGSISPELSQALNTSPAAEFEKSVNEKGYKPMNSRNQTFLGDLQLVSFYRLSANRSSSSLLQTTLTLPTGPKYDSDDLLSANTWGRTSIENTLIFGFQTTRRLSLNPYAGINIFIPDQVQRRIPRNEYDNLPAANQKETTQRQLGAGVKVGIDSNYDFTRAWSAGLGAEHQSKAKDNYSGPGENYRYDLLSEETDSTSSTLKALLNFSSVAAYRAKQALLPGIISIGISDVIAGKNVLKETRTELSTMLFF